MGTPSATATLDMLAVRSRTAAHISWAISGVAERPVPIAPHRLVGDDDPADGVRVESVESTCNLPRNDSLRLACLALVQRFAYAEDGCESRLSARLRPWR